MQRPASDDPTDDPSDQFLRDVAAIRVKAAGRDAALLRLGAALMPLGIVLGVVAWFLSHNTDNPLDQRDAIVLALIGVAAAVVGVGLFLRYSFAEFLRFWMARLVHQQDMAARTLAEAARRDGARPDPDPDPEPDPPAAKEHPSR